MHPTVHSFRMSGGVAFACVTPAPAGGSAPHTLWVPGVFLLPGAGVPPTPPRRGRMNVAIGFARGSRCAS